MEEQRRIAQGIDTADRLSHDALHRLRQCRAIVQRFRISSLSAAYRKASESESRELVPLEKLLAEPLKNGYSARPVAHETPFRVLTLTATTSGWFDGRHFKYTEEKFPPDSPFWLKPGDILVQRGNTAEYVGVPALYEGPPGELLYPDLMIRVRVKSHARFVWYMLLAPQSRNYLRERATGSAGNMPKINQTVLSGVPIPLPSAGARESLVAQLDQAMFVADAVEARLNKALLHVQRTSQAVLAKAFRGELVELTAMESTGQ